MNVRAKMKCISKSGTTVQLSAVCDDANKTWANYTPSANVNISIDNPPALAAFEQGKHYFVEFSPAPPTEAEEQ